MTLNEAGQVDYRAVIGLLNWRQHPVITTTTTTTSTTTTTTTIGGAPGLTTTTTTTTTTSTTTTTTTIGGAPPPGSATAAPYGGSVWKGSGSNEASGGERQLVQVVRADLLMQDLAATT